MDHGGSDRPAAAAQTSTGDLERAQALLMATFQGTATVTGPEFFEKSVETLAEALDVHTSFIAIPTPERSGWNELIAHWSGDAAGDHIQYDRAGTPCELTEDQELVSIFSGVLDQFPEDAWLVSLNATSYVALTLYGSDGARLGHLGLVDTQPCLLTNNEIASLRIFGSRIAAELERVQAEADHRERLAFRSQLAETAPFGSTYRTLEAGTEENNSAFEQIFGRTYRECRQLGWEHVIHPEDLDRYLDQAELLRTSGQPVQAAFRILHPDGTIRSVQRHGAAKLDATGQPSEFHTTVIDLTDSDQVQTDLLAAVAELDLRNAEINSSLNAFPDMRFRLDRDGNYLDAWAGDPATLIAPIEEIIGANIADHFPGELAAAILEAIATSIDNGEVASVKYQLGGPDLVAHYEARLAPLPEGQVMAVVRDISDFMALETQLVHAGTMQSIGRLAGGIAHDFNNVLHIIRGHAAALTRPGNDADSTERRVEAITRAVDRTASLIERLMTISRPTVDDPTPTIVDDFLTGLGPALSQMLGDAIALEMNLGAPGTAVVIDDSRLEAAVLNLISNANDAMADGGAMKISTTTTRSSLRLEVSDTGAGMSNDVADQVFEPFFTTKPAGVGTGLGLANTYNTVVGAGGTITLQSNPGEGATFVLELPITDLPAIPKSSGPRQVEARLRGATVLVVEDEPDVLELCADTLTDLGYHVLKAANGEDALALAEQHSPIDALLTDVVMPGLTGPELATELTARFPGTPVVFMSGYSPDAMSADIPPEQLLRKPFGGADLQNILVGYLP